MNRARALRLSILASIGIVPAACGGTVTNSRDGDGTSGSSATGQGGATGGTGGPGKMLPPRAGSTGTGVTTGTAGARDMGGSFGTGGGEGTLTCTSPQRNARTGLVTCAEGYSHRPIAVACGALVGQGGEPSAFGGAGPSEDPSLPRVQGAVRCGEDAGGVGGDGGDGPAVVHSNCHEFAFGFCEQNQDPFAGGFCVSGCTTDAECGAGFICLCDEPDSPTGGACRPSNCQTDASCGAGLLCASYDDGCGSGFACQAAGDACYGDADCASGHCGWDDFTKTRSCGSCEVGRPFIVESQARLAPVTSRGDWRAGATPRVDHLTKSERAALAEHWTKSGRMEHASIAAFARFSLQLLALGAPPELVEACTAALADETAHARLCFGFASAYAGHAVGPGPLDISRSLEVTSLADIVDLVIAEGCFGETSAALEALEAAGTASDPVIAAAYSLIARDEQRHAELAFRFVRWALRQGGDEVAERIGLAVSSPPTNDAATASVSVPCLAALLRPPALATARAPANLPVI